VVRAGKYGPYVNWGKVNATLPKSMTQEEITPEQAIELVNAKAAAGGGARSKTKASAKPAAAKTPAKAKSTTAKKAAPAKKAGATKKATTTED
jgi:DNA topoisomerase-1